MACKPAQGYINETNGGTNITSYNFYDNYKLRVRIYYEVWSCDGKRVGGGMIKEWYEHYPDGHAVHQHLNEEELRRYHYKVGKDSDTDRYIFLVAIKATKKKKNWWFGSSKKRYWTNAIFGEEAYKALTKSVKLEHYRKETVINVY